MRLAPSLVNLRKSFQSDLVQRSLSPGALLFRRRLKGVIGGLVIQLTHDAAIARRQAEIANFPRVSVLRAPCSARNRCANHPEAAEGSSC